MSQNFDVGSASCGTNLEKATTTASYGPGRLAEIVKLVDDLVQSASAFRAASS
jgi:hypothetical protein